MAAAQSSTASDGLREFARAHGSTGFNLAPCRLFTLTLNISQTWSIIIVTFLKSSSLHYYYYYILARVLPKLQQTILFLITANNNSTTLAVLEHTIHLQPTISTLEQRQQRKHKIKRPPARVLAAGICIKRQVTTEWVAKTGPLSMMYIGLFGLAFKLKVARVPRNGALVSGWKGAEREPRSRP
ncbi:hypothetical protein CC85DRAFT_283589 [Cutaneotrichosporon oleaginosum]|uniref:Uncharacterized protein n=1 Tax=Cutaneotrichosporon oleaginosum TaxID=879819 RepID=A0A0J0XTD8_9TREE|nr:uncharacterized protein CC85DRAFT_283589 [Cutaneotrichosporon oleaginosum]KLT44346.1 hypothetical protein CC85DRAFT_283589 [Cutaneotrichosporon oleaginosum]TXT07928.1 hypothetical protein COLE_04852 [Cutaneotrichosporon oleaginosum]